MQWLKVLLISVGIFALLGIDQCGVDADADGWVMCTTAMDPTSQTCDCDDGNAWVYPYAYEMCNGLDDNCNGQVDEWPIATNDSNAVPLNYDGDGDGYGEFAVTWVCPGTTGYVETYGPVDCDDSNPTVHPNATETCNGINDDCDWYTDEVYNFFLDADADGFGDVRFLYFGCVFMDGWVLNSADCSDTNASIYPGAAELCDSKDNDCDGVAEEGWDQTRCPSMNTDDDGDWYYEAWYDCDDTNPMVPSTVEYYLDGVDNDCDGIADEIPSGIKIYYFDGDGDGFGTSSSEGISNQPYTGVSLSGDCDDEDSSVYPGHGC